MKSGMVCRLAFGGLAALSLAGCVHESRRAALFIQPRPATVRVVNHTVQVSINNDVKDTPTYVWRAVSSALKTHGKASRFRASWHIVVLGGRSDSTAFYNRSQRTLKYYSVAADSSGKLFYERSLYGRVTDAALHKLAVEAGSGGAGLFLLPLRFGCTNERLAP